MPTIQQILDFVNRKYSNSETTANKVSDLNDIHTKIYVKLARMKNQFETYETQTIADQLTYSLPSNCRVNDIIAVRVSESTTITSTTEWDTFKYAALNDNVDTGYWWGDPGNGTISLVSDGLPISTADLSIRIYYYKRPTALSSDNLSAIPELDTDYHDLLKYSLIQELASQGDNPDTDIANYWQAKFDEYFNEVKKSIDRRLNTAPTTSNEVVEVW